MARGCSLLSMRNSFIKPSSALGMLMLGDIWPQVSHAPTYYVDVPRLPVPDLFKQTTSQNCVCSGHPCRVKSHVPPGPRAVACILLAVSARFPGLVSLLQSTRASRWASHGAGGQGATMLMPMLPTVLFLTQLFLKIGQFNSW